MTGTLYLVGTPIGNMEDVSLRALRIMQQVPLIAAEDTRVTGRLLARHQIDTPLTSYHEHNKLAKLPRLLTHLQADDLALVSDAGMPGLSDPGYELVRAAAVADIPVVVIPGPSAVISALAVSGLPTDRYLYLGFLPRRQGALMELLQSISGDQHTLVAFEAPHRLVKTLRLIQAVLGERPTAIARELTKLHEQVLRGTPEELMAHLSDHPPKGEITLVIGGAQETELPPWDEDQVRAALQEMVTAGSSPTGAAKAIAHQSGWPRRKVYRLATGQDPTPK